MSVPERGKACSRLRQKALKLDARCGAETASRTHDRELCAHGPRKAVGDRQAEVHPSLGDVPARTALPQVVRLLHVRQVGRIDPLALVEHAERDLLVLDTRSFTGFPLPSSGSPPCHGCRNPGTLGGLTAAFLAGTPTCIQSGVPTLGTRPQEGGPVPWIAEITLA